MTISNSWTAKLKNPEGFATEQRFRTLKAENERLRKRVERQSDLISRLAATIKDFQNEEATQ